MAIETDANGIVTSGKFQGHHISAVLAYAEELDTAVGQGKVPATAPVQTPSPADPNKALQDAAQARVAPLDANIALRLEQDDEQQFASTVPDYQKWKPEIDKMKQTLAPQVRIQRGCHRMLYGLIKQTQDPETQRHVYGGPAPVVTPNEDPPKQEETQPPVQQTPPPVQKTPEQLIEEAKKGTVTPKAASPVSTPTGAGRSATDGTKQSKLKANERIIAMCSALRVDLGAYLLEMEERGMTQENLDAAALRKPVYKSKIFA